MGFFDRIMRVIRANINSLIGSAEDPEKVLEQAVHDMQEDLIQLRQAVAQAIATQKRTERDYSRTQSTADEWHRRAQLALQKGDENLAREALTRKKSYQETAEAMRKQIELQTSVVSQLKQNMRSLEGKISEARSKKDLYIARARSAKAAEKIREMMGQLNTGSALSAFDRMEEKVLQLEARSVALAEMGADDLEQKFASLQDGGGVEAELAAMKAQMLTGSKPAPLPPSNSPAEKNPEI